MRYVQNMDDLLEREKSVFKQALAEVINEAFG